MYWSPCLPQRYRWPGASYEGGVLRGLRHGSGRQWFDDSEAEYDGQWRNGQRHGQGTLYFDAGHLAYYQGKHCNSIDETASMRSPLLGL
jgi:hypothetical protein